MSLRLDDTRIKSYKVCSHCLKFPKFFELKMTWIHIWALRREKPKMLNAKSINNANRSIITGNDFHFYYELLKCFRLDVKNSVLL